MSICAVCIKSVGVRRKLERGMFGDEVTGFVTDGGQDVNKQDAYRTQKMSFVQSGNTGRVVRWERN